MSECGSFARGHLQLSSNCCRVCFALSFFVTMKETGSFCFSPTLHELQYISVTSGFTRFSMKTKNVSRGLISLYVNFHNNRTMSSTNLHVKSCRWGGGKRAKKSYYFQKISETAELENSLFFWLFFLVRLL